MLRPSEWLLSAFFMQLVIGGWSRTGRLPSHTAVALGVPVAIAVIASADARARGQIWSVVRDWMPALLLLLAYWSVDWTAVPPVDRGLERVWVQWDRTLLNEWGLRAAIERFGGVVPTILELAYLALYGLFPIILTGFYLSHRRDRLERFVFPFLMGSLLTYALLPYFPSEAPRFMFSGEDYPHVNTMLRSLNVWILDRCDIRSSVFPSGHVAVAFSAAFAMRLAIPESTALAGGLLVLAVLVWANTVYGRYHYAADGLAALVVSAVTIGAVALLQSRPGRRHA